MRAGPFTKSFTLQSNDRNRPGLALTGTVQVRAAVHYEPLAISFGELPRRGGPQERSIRIRRGDAGPLNPELVTNPSQSFETSLREIEPGTEYELTVRVTPPWPQAGVRGQVVLRTGVPQQPQIAVSVIGTARPVARVMPASLRVGPAVPANTPRAIRVLWDPGEVGTITGAQATDPAIGVRIEGEGLQMRVEVDIPEGYAPAQPLGQKIIITTNHAEVPRLEVPLLVLPVRPGTPVSPPASVRPAGLAPTTAVDE